MVSAQSRKGEYGMLIDGGGGCGGGNGGSPENRSVT